MRKQRAFASLSEAELNQVVEWVRAQKYDDVIARVAQPRPEGFGLKVSRKPLQLLFAKATRLEKINAHLATGRNLTLTDLDQIEAGEKSDLGEEAHHAILIATHEIATNEDCNPTQLLALQRLADFPARSALRDQMAEHREQSARIRAERLEITRAKEARAKEMHTHKIQLDLRKQTHKEKNAAFKQDLALARLNPNLNLTPNLLPEALQDFEAMNFPDPTPPDQNANTQNPVHPVNPVQISSSPSLPSRTSVKSFLSPEVIANTNLYDQKIDVGEIRVIYAPGKHYEIEYCNPADEPALTRLHKSAPLRFFEDPTRTQWLPALRTFGPNAYIPPQSSSP